MDFSVQDLLSLDIMERASLLTCHDTVANLPVESVSVIELPVENFVRENEFILTTGIGFGQDEIEFKQFIHDVSACKASAIGVATGRHVLEIPESVLAAATQRRIPIVEIPWEVRFSDIIHDVLAALQSEQRRLLQQSNAIQEELLALILNSSGLIDIANFIEDKTETPVLIVDRRGYIAGRSRHSEELAHLWNESNHTNPTPLRPYQSAAVSSTLSSVDVEAVSRLTDSERFLKLPIRSATDVQGYLVLLMPSDTPVNSFLPIERAHILEHAATAAALCFLRLNLIQETETQLRHDFVFDLIQGQYQSWEAIAAQARFLGHELSSSHVCLVCVVDNISEVYQHGRFHSSLETWTKGIMERLETFMLDTAALETRGIMTATRNNELICFVALSDEEEQVKCLNTLVDQVERTASDLLPEVILSWGIGDVHEGPKTFQTGFKEALAALDVGKGKEGSKVGQRTHFADVELHRALSRLASNDDMQRIVNSLLGHLLEYDSHKNMDLRLTLEVYLRHQGNVSQTSRELNLHRQTLVYRLRKIESLTGRSLVDPDDLFLLDLALRVIDVTSPK